jgi:hypothetical protein
MTNEELKTFLDSDSGKSLKDFILGECSGLSSIYSVKECKLAEAQAIEFKSQLKALEKLQSILAKIMTIDNKELFDKEQYFNL